MYTVGSAVRLCCAVGLGGLFRRPGLSFSLLCMPSGRKPANLPPICRKASAGCWRLVLIAIPGLRQGIAIFVICNSM